MARKSSKLAQQYRNVFSGVDGQKVLAHLMAHCKVYAPILPTDGVTMAFENGQRNVGLMIATKLNYVDREFVQRAHDHNEALTHE
jgi:hypothetical protein